jgi:hypothetical protein
METNCEATADSDQDCLCKTLVRPLLTYGIGSRCLTRRDENMVGSIKERY